MDALTGRLCRGFIHQQLRGVSSAARQHQISTNGWKPLRFCAYSQWFRAGGWAHDGRSPRSVPASRRIGHYSKSPTAIYGYVGPALRINSIGDLEPLLLPPERLSCVIEAHQFHQICHQLFSKRARIWYSVLGGMAEWTIAAVLKTAEPKAPGVRIPLPPLAAMEPVSSLATKMNRGDTYGGGYLD